MGSLHLAASSAVRPQPGGGVILHFVCITALYVSLHDNVRIIAIAIGSFAATVRRNFFITTEGWFVCVTALHFVYHCIPLYVSLHYNLRIIEFAIDASLMFV